MASRYSSPTVLLVDDVKLIREIGASYLAGTGLRVIEACNGAEALEMTHQLRPDLVMMDLFMPVMTGDECCRRIKQNKSLQHIPVVMVTRAEREYLLTCVDADCDDILQKPFSPEKFLAVCKRFVNIAQQGHNPQIAFALHFGNDNTPFAGEVALDLCLGGVFLKTVNLLPVNTPLRFVFSFPAEGRIFEFQAAVSWQNPADYPVVSQLPPGMAVQFQNVSADENWVIGEFVRQLSIAHDPTMTRTYDLATKMAFSS